MRRGAFVLLAVFAALALARHGGAETPPPDTPADPEEAQEAAENPRFQSAAIAGRFKAMPPSPYGFAIPFLMEMREKLGGEPMPEPAAAPVAPESEPEPNGH